MTTALVLLVTVPLAVTVACIWLPLRAAQAATLASGLVSLGLVVALLWAPTQTVQIGWLMVDPLSLVFLLAVGFLYPAVAAYSIGYLADEAKAAADAGPAARTEFERYARRFSLGLNAFAWAMLCAPAVNGLALLWVAIEVTTVISALLVAIDATDGATEAAWKYVLIASSGLGIGLLATVFMYYAGAQVLGQAYDLAFEPLLQQAAQLPATPVRLAFVLAVLGFGTKVGLFPVHTWLPDAHSEAPSPVSALLSGALLVVSFYAILRYLQVAQITLGAQFPHDVLLVFGVASLALAALYLLDQRDLKRLLAYSSVEHMGILAIGVGFGAPMAAAGVLLHVLGHAAAKGNAFMGAGVLVRRFGTKDLHKLRGGLDALRWTGPLLLVAVLALSGMPPFALFRSEFQVVVGGFTTNAWAAAALVGLVVVAFAGLTGSITSVLFRAPATASDQPEEPATASRAGTGWMLAPVIAGVVVLVVLGVHPPALLVDLLTRGAAELTGGQ